MSKWPSNCLVTFWSHLHTRKRRWKRASPSDKTTLRHAWLGSVFVTCPTNRRWTSVLLQLIKHDYKTLNVVFCGPTSVTLFNLLNYWALQIIRSLIRRRKLVNELKDSRLRRSAKVKAVILRNLNQSPGFIRRGICWYFAWSLMNIRGLAVLYDHAEEILRFTPTRPVSRQFILRSP